MEYNISELYNPRWMTENSSVEQAELIETKKPTRLEIIIQEVEMKFSKALLRRYYS